MGGAVGIPAALLEPSPSDFDRWQQLVDRGELDPSEAARNLGFRGSSQFRRADPLRHAEVLQSWRERQVSEDRTLARKTLRAVADDREAPEAARVSAANSLLRMHEAADDSDVGDPGPKHLIVEGKRVAGIADVVRLAGALGVGFELGRLAGAAVGDVPAAGEVLSVAADGERAAGVVAAAREP